MRTGLLIAMSAVTVLAGCGGGSGSSSPSSGSSVASGGAGSASSTLSAGGSNVATVTVASGPGGSVNIPYVSVKVCAPGSTTQCATIDHVLVDTASMGLRVMASMLPSSFTLPPQADPNTSGNTIGECTIFADGYTWGAVVGADVYVAGEVARDIPINVVDDNGSYSATPTLCSSNGYSTTAISSAAQFGANGVLGVGLFVQDCGSGCATDASYDRYFTCSAGACQPVTEALADQVSNPVVAFASGNNNGVVLQLPNVSSGGAVSATGYLGFGIDTASNNALGSASILTANLEGEFRTTFGNGTYNQSIIDSGSNGYYFNPSGVSTLTTCADASDFYCPSSTLTLTATNQGGNGTMSTVSFQVANFDKLSGNNYAFNDVGGTATTATQSNLTQTFDWGLPFFYGRTVYFAIEGQTAGSTAGPFVAY